MKVASSQRFHPKHPCPICNGHAREARHQGKRCHGFMSFGSLEFLAGQVVGKTWVTLIAVALLWNWRRRLAPEPLAGR